MGDDFPRISNAGAAVGFGVTIFSSRGGVMEGMFRVWVASRFRGFSRFSWASGDSGGCTGTSGCGGTSVRGTTGGGGFDVGAWPSASINLRMRSSSVPLGVRGMGGGFLDVDVRFVCFLAALPAVFAKN